MPATYSIVYETARSLSASDGVVEAELVLSVANTGELDGVDIPVSVSVNGEAPQGADPIPRIAAGASAPLVIPSALPPGEHPALFRVGHAELEASVTILAADLAIATREHTIVSDGVVTVAARITNNGNLAADGVSVSAAWTPLPGAEGVEGSSEEAAALPALAPGESRDATLVLDIPTGAYNLALAVAAQSIEADAGDNASDYPLEIEYALLNVSVGDAEVASYEIDGDGVVQLSLRIVNAGVAHTGPLTVGASCPADAQTACGATAEISSVPPAGSGEAVLSLALPQGETTLTVFAGADEDTYRWGDRNTVAFAARVPEKPPIALSLAAPAEVAGYWSDGTADVEVSATVRNGGYRPVDGALSVTIACLPEGVDADGDSASIARLAIDDCGGVVGATLADGFGPATVASTVRVPMGVSVWSSLAGGAQPTFGAEVPERIVGVEREVWECYSDRPETRPTHANGHRGGCGGWQSPRIVKWDHDEPVRVWADPTGDYNYISILGESLDELAPLLNLEFEWVSDSEEASLLAYVGVPSSRNADIGFADYCEDANGCASRRHRNGLITSATLSVWLDHDDHRVEIKHITIHEALHALTNVHHPTNPLSMMSIRTALRLDRLLDFDLELYELHSNPLVEPDMAMEEVEEIIVFADELLDTPPEEREESGLQLAERAYAALIDADSARFRIKGGWGDSRGCQSLTFLGLHTLGDLGSGTPHIVRFDGNGESFIRRYSESGGWHYWWKSRGGWQEIDRISSDRTYWVPIYADPVDMLISILRYADAEDIEVTHPSSGMAKMHVTLYTTRVRPSRWWGDLWTLEASFTLDTESYEITDYNLEWDFDATGYSCSTYEVRGWDGRYGVGWE